MGSSSVLDPFSNKENEKILTEFKKPSLFSSCSSNCRYNLIYNKNILDFKVMWSGHFIYLILLLYLDTKSVMRFDKGMTVTILLQKLPWRHNKEKY